MPAICGDVFPEFYRSPGYVMSPVGVLTTASREIALHRSAALIPWDKMSESGENDSLRAPVAHRVDGSHYNQEHRLAAVLTRAHRTNRRRNNDSIQSP
jgi:hypothetical protein